MSHLPLHLPDHPDPLRDQVGNTPLVRLQSIPQGVVPDEVEIWCKLEWFNPGGSIKDRAAASMVLDAERRGRVAIGRLRRSWVCVAHLDVRLSPARAPRARPQQK